jgi:transposase
MKRIRDKVAGLDVHRDSVVACARVVEVDRSVTVTKASFATTSRGLGELARWLAESGAATVAMEATGIYWKPVYYVLEVRIPMNPYTQSDVSVHLSRAGNRRP